MKKIGLFYGSSTGHTAAIALKIRQLLGKERVDLFDVAGARPADLLKYDYLVLGIPTWDIGEMQDDWIDFLLTFDRHDYAGKKFALFGLGDQESYPDTFCDAMGRLYDVLEENRCRTIGEWPAAGYEFMESTALRKGKFVGLVLDEENQPSLSDDRISAWILNLDKEIA